MRKRLAKIIVSILVFTFTVFAFSACKKTEELSTKSFKDKLTEFQHIDSSEVITLNYLENATVAEKYSKPYASTVNIISIFLYETTIYIESYTGVFINEQGYIISTCDSAYNEKYNQAKLVLFSFNSPQSNQILYELETLSYSKSANLSLFKPKNTFKYKTKSGEIKDGIENYVTFTDLSNVKTGTNCYFIKNDELSVFFPFSTHITTGIISQLDTSQYDNLKIYFCQKEYSPFIYSAGTSLGSFGGCIFNTDGYALGLSIDKIDNATRLNIAVPSQLVIDYLSNYNNVNKTDIKIYRAIKG